MSYKEFWTLWSFSWCDLECLLLPCLKSLGAWNNSNQSSRVLYELAEFLCAFVHVVYVDENVQVLGPHQKSWSVAKTSCGRDLTCFQWPLVCKKLVVFFSFNKFGGRYQVVLFSQPFTRLEKNLLFCYNWQLLEISPCNLFLGNWGRKHGSTSVSLNCIVF